MWKTLAGAVSLLPRRCSRRRRCAPTRAEPAPRFALLSVHSSAAAELSNLALFNINAALVCNNSRASVCAALAETDFAPIAVRSAALRLSGVAVRNTSVHLEQLMRKNSPTYIAGALLVAGNATGRSTRLLLDNFALHNHSFTLIDDLKVHFLLFLLLYLCIF